MPRKPLTRLTAVEREEKSVLAVELSAKGWNYSEIGAHEEIGLDRRTVKKLIGDELANRAEHREHEKEKAIAVYEAIIRHGWRRLARTKDASLNVSGVLNSIKGAQDSINKITGAESPIKIQDVDGDWDVIWADADEAALRD